jgi:hypothetical protein
MQLAITTTTLQLSPTASLKVEGADHFHLKAYDKRRLKCDISVAAKSQNIAESELCKTVSVTCGEFEWLFPI